MTNLEKTSREIHKLLRGTSLCYDVDTDHCDPASVGEVVRQQALCGDLTIVGPALLNDENLGPPVVNGCLFDTGKPVLVVPKDAEATLSQRRLLVGWDSRTEASRAIREALDLLCGAGGSSYCTRRSAGDLHGHPRRAGSRHCYLSHPARRSGAG
ncbi:hypothetical protein NKI74_21390 [Mesorhizobium sp. M0494]|uniref:hypothetical protein n=1 Tax=Mesorhizobium sp. M0494 TaxID=2956951 RepID=UPI00333D828E